MLSPKVTALKRAPIAQLDRASGYGPEGLGFKSLWVYHFFYRFSAAKFRLQIFYTKVNPFRSWLFLF